MRSPSPCSIVALFATSLLSGCATDSARERAVVGATDELLGQLRDRGLAESAPGEARTDTPSTEGRGQPGSAPPPTLTDVILEAPAELWSDIAVELKRSVNVLSRGEHQEQVLEELVGQLREIYGHDGEISSEAQAGLQQLEGLGGQRKADLLVITDAQDYPDRRVKITLLAYRLADGSLVATGVGSSQGVLQVAGTVLIWATSPFVALYDVARWSARYAFSGSEEPTILGTLGKTLLAVIYLPVAFFTCDYELTKSWVAD